MSWDIILLIRSKRSIQTNWRRPTLAAPLRPNPTPRWPVAAASVPRPQHPQLQNLGRRGVGSLTRRATYPVHLRGFSDVTVLGPGAGGQNRGILDTENDSGEEFVVLPSYDAS